MGVGKRIFMTLLWARNLHVFERWCRLETSQEQVYGAWLDGRTMSWPIGSVCLLPLMSGNEVQVDAWLGGKAVHGRGNYGNGYFCNRLQILNWLNSWKRLESKVYVSVPLKISPAFNRLMFFVLPILNILLCTFSHFASFDLIAFNTLMNYNCSFVQSW